MRKARRQSEQSRWTRDRDKESYWRAQMALWQKSGLSVRAYCKEQGVIETTFYAWRRELNVRSREANSADVQQTPTEQARATMKDSRGRTIPRQFRETERHPIPSDKVANNPFVPLTIVQQDAPGRPECANAGPLTLVTPSGFRIIISSSEDLCLLEKILDVVEKR